MPSPISATTPIAGPITTSGTVNIPNGGALSDLLIVAIPDGYNKLTFDMSNTGADPLSGLSIQGRSSLTGDWYVFADATADFQDSTPDTLPVAFTLSVDPATPGVAPDPTVLANGARALLSITGIDCFQSVRIQAATAGGAAVAISYTSRLVEGA